MRLKDEVRKLEIKMGTNMSYMTLEKGSPSRKRFSSKWGMVKRVIFSQRSESEREREKKKKVSGDSSRELTENLTRKPESARISKNMLK